MDPQLVLREQRDSTAIVILNRPERLNALDYPLIDALLDAFDNLETDSNVRAIILTGTGQKAFCSGADVHSFAPSVAAGPEAALRDFVRRGHRLTSRIETFPKPVIVAVNGLAHGGGCEITEAAPLAIASSHAEFCKAEITLGFAPPFGGTQRLPRLVGRKRALKMILTGRPITAEEAQKIGLVNDVVAPARLMDECLAIARRIAEMSPLAVAACLTSVTRGLNLPIHEGLEVEAQQFARMVATADTQEGISAWLEKRVPRYSGT